MTDQEQAFLSELSELTKRHKITIGGCGCCGSPFLTAHSEIKSKGRYILNASYAGEVVFVEPGDPYWDRNKVQA